MAGMKTADNAPAVQTPGLGTPAVTQQAAMNIAQKAPKFESPKLAMDMPKSSVTEASAPPPSTVDPRLKMAPAAPAAPKATAAVGRPNVPPVNSPQITPAPRPRPVLPVQAAQPAQLNMQRPAKFFNPRPFRAVPRGR